MYPIFQLLPTKTEVSIRRLARLILIAATLVLAGGVALVSGENERARIKLLTPSLGGSTGLFTVPVADTLRQGEFSLGWAAERYHRDPGALKLTGMPLSIAVGVHDRVEFFASFEVYKRLAARDVLTDKVSAVDPLLPAVIASAGEVGYFNDAPFVDVASGSGTGNADFGLKLNLLSQYRGSALSLALQPRIRVPGLNHRSGRLKGLTAGVTDASLDLVVTRFIGGKGTLTGRAGLFSGRDVDGVARQNRVQWGLGLEWPVWSSALGLMAELAGDSFLGDREVPLVNVVSPLEAKGGIRVRTAPWLTLSGGVSLLLKNAANSPYDIVPSNRFGWVFQASLQRKVNRPPTITCKLDEESVLQGDIVVIRAEVADPDDDYLWISWKARSGYLLERGRSVEFDTSDLQPGSYSVVGEVGDDRNVAFCVAEIKVRKRKVPPQISCRPVPREVKYGDSVLLEAEAVDVNDDRLSYVWTVNGTEITNNRDVFEFGTVGRSPGRYKIRVTVTDVDKLSAGCSYELDVLPAPEF